MARREAILCNSVAVTAVLVSVVIAVGVYRNNPRRLLQIVYVLFLGLAGVVGARYLWFALQRWLKTSGLWRRESQGQGDEAASRPEFDTRRERVLRDAQATHNEKVCSTT